MVNDFNEWEEYEVVLGGLTLTEVQRIGAQGPCFDEITTNGYRLSPPNALESTDIVFLSGPITGVANYKERFAQVQRHLEYDIGCVVLNPAMLPERGLSYEACMRITSAMLAESTAICLLPSWDASKGCEVEMNQAANAGIKVVVYAPCFDLWMGKQTKSQEETNIPYEAWHTNDR